MLGEANCIQGLGHLDEAKGKIARARGRWREALALYARIPEPYSIGFAHIRLARHAATPRKPPSIGKPRGRHGSRSTGRT